MKQTSKVTKANTVVIPAEIREHLGVAPGAEVEWELNGNGATMRRAGKYTLQDIRALFKDRKRAEPLTNEEMDEAIGDYLNDKHLYGRR